MTTTEPVAPATVAKSRETPAVRKPAARKRKPAVVRRARPLPVVPEAAEPEVTVLSLGGGQDSTEILYRLIFDPAFRARYAPKRLVVVFSDTVDEHDETYTHLDYLDGLCAEHGVEMHRLTPDMGFHGTGYWALGLVGFQRKSRTVGSKCFRKSCTDNLKIKPIYRWLSAWLARVFGFPTAGPVWKTKEPLVEYAKRFGRVRMLIGFAKGEEKRVAADATLRPWMRLAVARVFPLVELGLDRAACVASMTARGLPVPPPQSLPAVPVQDRDRITVDGAAVACGVRRVGGPGTGETRKVRPPGEEELRRVRPPQPAGGTGRRRNEVRPPVRPRDRDASVDPRALRWQCLLIAGRPFGPARYT